MNNTKYWKEDLLSQSSNFGLFLKIEGWNFKTRVDTFLGWLRSDDFAAIEVAFQWYLRMRMDRWQGGMGKRIEMMEAGFLTHAHNFLAQFKHLEPNALHVAALHTCLSIAEEISSGGGLFWAIDSYLQGESSNLIQEHCLKAACANLPFVLLPIERIGFYESRILPLVMGGGADDSVIRALGVLHSETSALAVLDNIFGENPDQLRNTRIVANFLSSGCMRCRSVILNKSSQLVAKLASFRLPNEEQWKIAEDMRRIEKQVSDHKDFLSGVAELKVGSGDVQGLIRRFKYSIFGGEDLEMELVNFVGSRDNDDELRREVFRAAISEEDRQILWSLGGWLLRQDQSDAEVLKFVDEIERIRANWREYFRNSANRPTTHWHMEH